MSRNWRDQRGNRDRDRSDTRPNPMDDPKFRDIMDRMQQIQQRHPIDWEDGLKRIEAMLPPEQAAAGRTRREQWMAQNGNAGGPWGGPGAGRWGGAGPGGWGRANRDNNDPNSAPGDDRRGRRNRRRSPDQQPGTPDQQNKPGVQSSGGVAGEATPAVITLPTHPWDTYTATFIRTNG